MISQRSKLIIIAVVLALGSVAAWLFISTRHGKIDINTASYAELDAIPYVTPEAAKGIIADRPFESVDELVRVSGIGEKTLEKIRKHVKAE